MHFHGIVNDQVHELIEALRAKELVEDAAFKGTQAYPDLPLEAEGQLLVQPDADCLALLQQAENEVDRGQQCLAASHGGGIDLVGDEGSGKFALLQVKLCAYGGP